MAMTQYMCEQCEQNEAQEESRFCSPECREGNAENGHEIVIKIIPHSEGGYSYDIFADQTAEEIEDGFSTDGGLCTSGRMIDALDMVTEMAKETIERLKANDAKKA